MRRSTSRPPTATRLAVQSNSSPRTQTWTAPASSATERMTATRSGAVSPTTAMLPGLTMPALSRAIPSRVGPSTSVWSKLMFVSTATIPSTTLVESHVPPSPTSTTAASTASSENQWRAAAVSSSKRVGRSASCRFEQGEGGEDGGEHVVVDRLAVPAEPLVDAGEVRAGVRPDAETHGAEQRGRHRRGRTLAVGPGQMDGRVGELGVTEQRDELAHPLERRQGPPTRHGGLEIDVPVEPARAPPRGSRMVRWPTPAPVRRRPGGSGRTSPGARPAGRGSGAPGRGRRPGRRRTC